MTGRVAFELLHTYDTRYGEILGFMLGDGCLKKQLSFSNAKMECMKEILKNFETVFGIGIEKFSFYLQIPTNSSEKECEKFWTKNLGIKNVRISKGRKTMVKQGILTARITNKEIEEEIKEGIKRVLQGKINQQNTQLGFLRGFFAAEGAIIPGKVRKEVPNSVQFPQKGKEIPNSISKMLKKFGIENRVVIKERKADYYCVNITGYENFEKLYSLGILDMHPDKKEKMRKGLSSYKKKISRKYVTTLKLLRELQKRPMTRNEIYDSLESYPQKINSLIYSQKSCLVKGRLIQKSEENGSIIWKLTENGEKFIRLHS
ncbi:hypothetical protein JXA56_03255 [Candidatus Micrarchaeota archaeon]|nr:hypothetical protein [Candidatus Micrarchaeota archaeon]